MGIAFWIIEEGDGGTGETSFTFSLQPQRPCPTSNIRSNLVTPVASPVLADLTWSQNATRYTPSYY